MADIDQLSDLAEQIAVLYADRFGVERDATWYLGTMTEELGEVTSAYLKLQGQGRGEGSRADLEDEVADLLGFVLLFARWQGIDAGAALERKWGGYLGPQ
jgi:NTP pyrophosphatase (non-canonical NTP hydrolase)